MEEVKNKTVVVTADMPTDYVATNGHEYVLKSKYTKLIQQVNELIADQLDVDRANGQWLITARRVMGEHRG